MKEFWNERYGQEKFAYGEEPNEYLKEKVSVIPVGRALFPADGEGRNSVYVAKLGWQVFAFDQSERGIEKAICLADKHSVKVNYSITDVENFTCEEKSFDMIALIYAHFPGDKRKAFHQKLSSFLRSGGRLIIEGFSKRHVINQQENPTAGGPRDSDMLYDLEELKGDFPDYGFAEAYEFETTLNEGNYHSGNASVIRIFATKR